MREGEKIMLWRDIERLIKEHFVIIVEPRRSGNRYWIRQGQAYFEISSLQFDKLLEGGYLDPDYRIERNTMDCTEQMIYTGR